jgi:hypothetical protein
MILNSYKKDGLDYIVIDNLYTDSELNAIKRELNELIPRLKPVETVDSAYLLESGHSEEKIYIKDCLSIWLDDVYIWDRTRSNILNMSRKLFNNKEITSFCTKVNAFFGHMEQSNVDFTLLNMYKSGEKYLSHIDSSMISVITLFEVGKVLEGGIKFTDYDEHISFKDNRAIIFPGCVRHETEPIKLENDSYRASLVQFLNYATLK